MHLLFLILFSKSIAQTIPEGMREMPRLGEDHSYTVTGEENFSDIQGFGEDTEKINMMYQMMVEGSGMEGMSH
jgi:hypothetical protein